MKDTTCQECGGPKDRRAKTCRACVRRPADPEVQALIKAGHSRRGAYRMVANGPPRPPGRPPKDLPGDLVDVVAELLEEGLSMAAVAERLGVHRATMYRRLEALEE